ncbi:HAMP domain-containing methyl-accepting chemotaxis protein [Anaeromyxobacter diazotrophicus]|uniref:Chemotaxis protein n=1 Tax=Anaeromyxobacter diazotrophicus TaxID=2590199 RepID=A0A7I9VIL6_9BACT|nr:methyl-accepting chemotaxis protein [Anaeromyxobacter diazotrophicus]GEJ55978.1 chemotaxis protein [Anaeromyxobacter diazotrophicus]
MLARLRVGTKILLGYAVAVAITALVGVSAYVGTHRVSAQLEDVVKNDAPAVVALGNVAEGEGLVARYLNVLYMTELGLDDPIRLAAREGYAEGLKHIDDAIAAFERTTQGPTVTRAWREAKPLVVGWEQSVGQARSAISQWEEARRAGRPDLQEVQARAWSAYTAQLAALTPAQKTIDALQDVMESDLAEARKEADVTSSAAITVIVVTVLVGSLGVFALGLLIARGIRATLRRLVHEAAQVTGAVERGDLKVRADPAAVHPEFRPVVQGMNATVDAFARPLGLTVERIERISKGDLPEPIAERFQGDFEIIKDSLNRCIAAVAAVVQDGKALAAAALEGNLSARADADRHQGDFRKIVEGFNGTLDAVMKPVDEATEVLEHLAQRDLRARVSGQYRGDHAKISEALNATAEALHDALAQVAQAVGQVSSASAQIASSSQAVASGASEQASSLEETSSSLESMSAMTKQAADNAQQASALTTAARGAATEGAAAMEQMTAAMGKIKASAEGTSQIIKDINEIAFQTNLLALNAAVEAARAGEAGRGFAVVAEEVRSLALRSKEAANKTEALIRQSVKEAGEGEVTAGHVNERLSEIVGSVSKMTDLVAEISASAKEQAAGIAQVSRAMEQMNTVTQQNAASSEESSSAASELSGQAEELAAMVGVFQLESKDGAALGTRAAALRGPGVRASAAPARWSSPRATA